MQIKNNTTKDKMNRNGVQFERFAHMHATVDNVVIAKYAYANLRTRENERRQTEKECARKKRVKTNEMRTKLSRQVENLQAKRGTNEKIRGET